MYYTILGLLLMFFFSSCSDIPIGSTIAAPGIYGKYSEASVDYFLEIGFCPELSECPKIPAVKRWNSNIRIKLYGDYTITEEHELDKIIQELSTLTGLNIKRVNNNPNIKIHFIKQEDFIKLLPSYSKYSPQNGLFYITYNNTNNIITESLILIENHIANIEDYHQNTIKTHLLREELTQSLGIPQDSYQYPNSIFQQDPHQTPLQYSTIDKQVIQMLYDPKIRPGMTKQQVKTALTTTTLATVNN